MPERVILGSTVREEAGLYAFGLSPAVIRGAVEYVHKTIDSIDLQLGSDGGERLAQLVELANLSAIIGNLFRTGVCRASEGMYRANAPHTYPDLIGNHMDACDVEIKVALEGNKPKGHLVKPGPHIIVRYVLAQHDGGYVRGKENRGVVPWIWEVRVGDLSAEHFNVSNTEGDSGKTAVINSLGMTSLNVVYLDEQRYPLARRRDSLVRRSRSR